MRLHRRSRRPRPWQGTAQELASRLVWILGSPRSGSTWLMHLLGASPRAVMISEPGIGVHTGTTVGAELSLRTHDVPSDRIRVRDLRAGDDDYVFADRWSHAWRGPLRELILARLHAQVVHECAVRRIADPVVVVKEPHGSQDADLLMSLLPESKLLFLMRDGRDVLDSEVDAASAGSWASWATNGFVTADLDREGFLRDRAHLWVLRTTAVRHAFSAHDPDRRWQLRYEDLLDDTAGHLGTLDRWLDLGLGERAAVVADRGRVERQPEQVRGAGRFIRAATPGRWRDSLSTQEQVMVEDVMGSTLRECGYP